MELNLFEYETKSYLYFPDEWQGLIDDCLLHIDPSIQESARTAIPAFFSRYYQTDNGRAKADIQGNDRAFL